MESLDLDAGLSIVIPFYNEGPNTRKCVDLVLEALKEISIPSEIIVVNDGSNDGISQKDFPDDIKYIEHQHSGRFKTRYLGLINSNYPNVLFIDARVWLNQKSLINVKKLIQENQKSKYWNGYINTTQKELALVSIWETLVMIGWGKGVNQPETVHFGLDEFDRYPKGTTLFLAPKNDWIEAFQKLDPAPNKFISLSDDTKLLRVLAANGDIWIDRGFSADYQPRTTFSKFIRNAFYRGRTFVDSYWESPTIFGKLVRGSIPVAVAEQYLSLKYLDIVQYLALNIVILLLLVTSLFIYSQWKWRDGKRAIREALVLMPLLLIFGMGFLLSYFLVAKNHLRRK